MPVSRMGLNLRVIWKKSIECKKSIVVSYEFVVHTRRKTITAL